jgi:hypothetical protein
MKHALAISCMHEGCDACLALECGYCCHLGYDGVGKAFELINADHHQRYRTLHEGSASAASKCATFYAQCAVR